MHHIQLLLFQLLVQGVQLKFSTGLEMKYQQKVHLDMILAENSCSFSQNAIPCLWISWRARTRRSPGPPPALRAARSRQIGRAHV